MSAPSPPTDSSHLPASHVAIPLCVDLDGTLISGDTLHEAFATLLVTRPIAAIRTLWALRNGRAAFKAAVAAHAPLDRHHFNLRPEVLALIDTARADVPPRPIVLATAAHETHARAAAAQLDGRVDAVLATDGRSNLKGETKAQALIQRFGVRGFDYVGDDAADLPVWRSARRAYAIGADRPTRDALMAAVPDAVVLDERPPAGRAAPGSLHGLLKALRPRQWAKNLLILLAPLGAFVLADPAVLMRLALAFVAFSTLASAVYLTNDVADIASDRSHPTKRRRPVAAGELPPLTALAVAAVLALAGLSIFALLSLPLLLLGIGYLVTCLVYNAHLKQLRWWDIGVLAVFYNARVVAGAWAAGVAISGWLVAFATASFLSLAALKRALELGVRRIREGETAKARSYRQTDRGAISTLGAACGQIAAVMLAAYAVMHAPAAGYRAPYWLLLLALAASLAFARIWWAAAPSRHPADQDDPIRHVVQDPLVWLCLGVGGLALLLAR